VSALATKAFQSLTQADQGQKYYEYQVPNVQWEMDRLGGTLPALKTLESKLDLMNQLKPELKSLVDDINSITDTSDLSRAKEGGRAIKRMLTS